MIKAINTIKLSQTIEIKSIDDKIAIQKGSDFPYYLIQQKNIIAKVEKENGKMYLTAFSTFVTLKCVIIKENDETFLRLKFKNKNGIIERDFSASILSGQAKELSRFGIISNNYSYLVDYLLKQYEASPVIVEYTHLGWGYYNERLAFRLDYLYLQNGYLENMQYNGDFNIKPEGSYDVWEDMVKKEVCGNTPMEFVLALGFASPVLALLDEHYDLGAILVNLSNTTSKGKTTAAMLAASVFGKPKTGNSTMLSYNITKNALPETVSKFSGITIAIDEAAILKSKDFSKLLYTICSGTSKGRIKSSCSGDIQLGKVTHFSSIVVSTAEFDLLNEDSEGGLRVRVFEINDTFTKSAENSNKIKKTVLKNYGEAGIGFVMHLMKKHASKIEEDYAEIIDTLKINFEKKTDITDRLIERFAVILLTVKYCNDCKYFQFKFNYKAMFDYVLKLINNIDSRFDYEERIKDIILEDYSMNISSYPSRKENLKERFCNSQIHGLTEKCSDGMLYYVMPSVFEKLMKERKVLDVTSKLKKLRDIGVLCTVDKNRLKKKIKIRGVEEKVYMYCFKFKD